MLPSRIDNKLVQAAIGEYAHEKETPAPHASASLGGVAVSDQSLLSFWRVSGRQPQRGILRQPRQARGRSLASLTGGVA